MEFSDRRGSPDDRKEEDVVKHRGRGSWGRRQAEPRAADGAVFFLDHG